MVRWLIVVVVWLTPWSVLGHALTTSNLRLTVDADAIAAEWAIAIRDLDAVLGLDTNGDALVEDDELQQRATAIADYARTRVELKADGRWCRLTGFTTAASGAHLIVRFAAQCPSALRELRVRYDLFFEHDPAHRGMLTLAQAGRTHSRTFSADTREQTFALDQSVAWWKDLLTYVEQGVWHIWLGFDHILFLVVLLLPAALHAGGKRATFLAVLKVVTSFTLAHSLTLVLAGLEIVNPAPRWIEAAIAASVLFVALRNLGPQPGRHNLAAAFGFGLIHGFGFANVLSELHLPRATFALCLFGFNLGVELGQLCLVAGLLPLLFLAREAPGYRTWAVRRGSLVIAAVAAVLMTERVLDVSLVEAGLRAISGETGAHVARSERANAARRLGSRLAREHSLKAAAEHYEEAAILFGELGDAASEADCHARVGDLALARAEPSSAVAAYQRALAIRERLQDVRGMLAQYHNLHLAARVRSDLTEAAHMLRRAVDAARQARLREPLARHTTELARLYRETDQLPAAAATLEEAIERSAASDDDAALAEHLEELGNVHKLRGDLGRAASTYRRALQLKEALGETTDAADIHANSADVARQQGRRTDAVASYQRALALYAAGGQARKAERVSALIAELTVQLLLPRKEGTPQSDQPRAHAPSRTRR